MSVDHIRYDLLTQQALRSVVRRVLSDVARTGLPGEHHFYISFDTHAPGVKLSSRLRAQYPDDMTVVLQHQFWDLTVTEQGFEVGLSFNGINEKLGIPFDAIKGFFDPSVQFGLQFETMAEGEAVEKPAPVGEVAMSKPGAKPRRAPRAETVEALPAAPPSPAPPQAAPTPAPASPTVSGSGPEPDKPSGGAEVVRLDRFRKK